MASLKENQQHIKEFLTQNLDKESKIALIGIGNEDLHDDFTGSYIIRALEQKGLQRDNLMVIDAGTGPSNYIADIATWEADCLLMIDAVDAQEPTGTLLLVDKEQLHTQSVDSHSNAKVLLVEFLIGLKPDLKVIIVGIQVKDISLKQALTTEVQQSADWLIGVLYELLI